MAKIKDAYYDSTIVIFEFDDGAKASYSLYDVVKTIENMEQIQKEAKVGTDDPNTVWKLPYREHGYKRMQKEILGHLLALDASICECEKCDAEFCAVLRRKDGFILCPKCAVKQDSR